MEEPAESIHIPKEADMCAIVSERSLNATVLASQVIAATYALSFYFVVLLLSVFGVCFKPCVKLFSAKLASIGFLIGALMVSVNVFTNSNDLEIKLYYRIISVSLVGIAFTLFGGVLFFCKPIENQSTLGKQQPSMGLIVTAITFPLIAIEVLLLVAAQAVGNDESETNNTKLMWKLVKTDKAIFLAQKLIQAATYLWLRNKTTCTIYKENAQFYFKILAFFNFVEWVDSQVNAKDDIHISRARDIYGAWFDVFEALYTALVIDYRLLCSLLFLEHSLEIENNDHEEHEEETLEETANGGAGSVEFTTKIMTPSDRQKRNAGFMVGFLCLVAPVVCGLYYVPKLHMSAWINCFAMAVHVALVVFGTVLLFKNVLEEDQNNKESMGVKIMVCCLGAVGFVYWMVKATLIAFWAYTETDNETTSYFTWTAAKLALRGLTAMFLVVLFLKVNARSLPQTNENVKINHILVPVIILGILSEIATTLIDQYVGPTDKKIRCEIKEESLRILFEAGPPMYLGFLFHVCLHFVVTQTKMGVSLKKPEGAVSDRTPDDTTRLLEGSSRTTYTVETRS